ncbi:hypothetical protein FIBSPDRAFT_671949, partial [Athelia psychrophila]
WDEVIAGMEAAIEKLWCSCTLSKKDKKHCRGPHPAKACGISHGGGQTHLMTLRLQSRANDRVFAEFKENRHMKRVAGFGSSTFLYYGPKLYECYCRYLSLLCDHDNGIADNWNFTNSIFSTTTVNFGPNTVCYNHLDFTNAAARWYTIMSAGNYDPKRGGHLILFDIKTVVKFPLGSTILIPSLVMRHSNTPIQKGETLSGITQYSAGTLFHWV